MRSRQGRRHTGYSQYLLLTVLAYLVAYLATSSDKGSAGSYLLAGYALAMLLNVLFPHVLATIIMRRYAPGTATALLLNLPITVLLLSTAIRASYIQLTPFLWVGPLVTGCLLGAIRSSLRLVAGS